MKLTKDDKAAIEYISSGLAFPAWSQKFMRSLNHLRKGGLRPAVSRAFMDDQEPRCISLPVWGPDGVTFIQCSEPDHYGSIAMKAELLFYV